MKRTLLAAALTLLGASSAFAQSAVNVYGRLNTTVERQKSGTDDPVWHLQNNASRIGFRGNEDLGGGLKAGFIIEHGFNPDTGAQTQSRFWARQSEVFVGATAGTLRLGNFTSEAYYATADFISMHNHDTGTSADALYAYLGRDTNKVAYRSPLFGGFYADAAVSLAEGAAPNRTMDLALNGAVGPVQLGAGYQKDGNANQYAIRGLYEIGSFTVGAYVQRDKDGFASGNGSRTTLRLSAMYTLGSSEFHLNFGRAGDYSNVANSKANQATVGYNYNLSKRTKVYGFYTKLNDSVAGVYGGDFSSFAVGMRHNF